MAAATTLPSSGAETTPEAHLQLFPEAKQAGEHFQQLPNTTVDGIVHAHARQTIQVDPQTLYNLWSKVENFPRWQEQVVSVTQTSPTNSHWVMGNPEDPKAARVEFDSEITEDLPGSRIAWKSISGDVEQSGSVDFANRRDGRGTVVTLIQSTKVPGGAIGNAIAAILKRSPRQIVIENLRHFKELAETGEIPSVKGQPHGPRGLSGKAKEWMYGETNPTPPGTSNVDPHASAS